MKEQGFSEETASKNEQRFNATLADANDNIEIISKKIEEIKASAVTIDSEQAELIARVEAVLIILKKIDIVAKTVAVIAEKTQLISVNASIEAARSGMEGKSFSVIAQEIKSLANESKETVKQVETFTLDITKSIQDILKVLKLDSAKLTEQVKHVDDVFSILNNLLDNIKTLDKTKKF